MERNKGVSFVLLKRKTIFNQASLFPSLIYFYLERRKQRIWKYFERHLQESWVIVCIKDDNLLHGWFHLKSSSDSTSQELAETLKIDHEELAESSKANKSVINSIQLAVRTRITLLLSKLKSEHIPCVYDCSLSHTHFLAGRRGEADVDLMKGLSAGTKSSNKQVKNSTNGPRFHLPEPPQLFLMKYLEWSQMTVSKARCDSVCKQWSLKFAMIQQTGV